MEYIERVRRARRAIAGGARRWVEKARLTRYALLARIMVLEEICKDCIEEAFEEEKLEQFWKNAMLSLVYRYRWKRRIRKRRARRRSLEEDCAVRAQRAARYFLATRMMARWRRSHMVIKRSFRRYFFRRYKKQLRRIMNCWRSYWLRHHLKLIQRVYRGVLGRRFSRVVRLKAIAAEAVRGAREVRSGEEQSDAQ